MFRETIAAALWLVRSPVAAFDQILAKKPYRLLWRIVLLGQAPLLAYFYVYTLKSLPGRLPGLVLPNSPQLGLIIMAPLFVIIQCFLWAAILTLVNRLLVGKNSFRVNLLIYTYAQAPCLFLLPLLLLGIVVPAFYSILVVLFSFLQWWILFFLYIGLLRAHGRSPGRTLLVLLSSWFLVLLLVVAFAVLLSIPFQG